MAALCSGAKTNYRMNLRTVIFILFLASVVLLACIQPAKGKKSKLNPKVPKDREELAKEQTAQQTQGGEHKPSKVSKDTNKPKPAGKPAEPKKKKLSNEIPEETTREEEHEEKTREEPANESKVKQPVKKKEQDEIKEEEERETREEENHAKKLKEKDQHAEETDDHKKDEDATEKEDKDKKLTFNPKQGKHNKKGHGGGGKKFKLSTHPSCAEDVAELCGNVAKGNNLVVLMCLQDHALADEDKVSEDCHNVLWQYKYNLTTDIKFDQAAASFCGESIKTLENCKKDFEPDGSLVNCLVENRELVSDKKCRTFLQKMASVVFNDYRLIKGFYQSCWKDVSKLGCGKISDDKTDVHKQVEVVECLEDHVEKLDPECKTQINRVAELSSDDYHLDRALFYACQAARNRFCDDVVSGEGKVYKCLMKHKDEETMDPECQDKLRVREKLMAENVKVNHPLWEHCHKHYEDYKCSKGKTETGKAAHLLLCLNDAIAQGKEVNAQCQAEMQDFGAQLFQDYKLNPQIVKDCEMHLQNECNNDFKPNGAVLDCLMGLMKEDKLNKHCYKSVHAVLKETGAGTHYKIDRPLYVACDNVIESLCKDKKEAMVLGCLMDNIYSDVMTPACQEKIFHLQYFLARDFSLDQSLYKDCNEDAKSLCSVPNFAEEDLTMPPGIILSCLFRATHESVEKAHQVSKKCAAHVRRVMHQRASSVKLMPEIQIPCMANLGDICLDKTKEGEEIDCLQQNYDRLSADCKSAIANFTEMESEDMELDKDLVQACSPMVAKFCQDLVDKGDSENVLTCLTDNKNNAGMDPKCQVAIEHWQLIEMKEFKFSHKLKKACYDDVGRNCEDKKTKFEAVTCLSAIIKEDTLKEQKHRISKECRSQIHEELKLQSENIQLNPELMNNCKEDLDRLCQNIPYGGAEAEECLRRKHKQLSSQCKNHLFQEELVESKDNELDYQLMHTCHKMIKIFCADEAPQGILRCLRKFKNDIQMDKSCRKIITERQIEGSERFELDPDLSEFCDSDVKKHCSDIKDPDHGKIILCLKKQLQKETLSPECDDFVRTRVEEAAQDYRLDPVLEEACRMELPRVCPDIEPGRGKVVDCLKKNYNSIKSKDCKAEIARLLEEGVEDIHADPPLMNACTGDIETYCRRPRGHGSVVNCLMDIYNAKSLKLEGRCHQFMTERIRLWNYANVETHFSSLGDIAAAVHASPERNYIYLVSACILGVLFFGGLCFGRVTKRVSQQYKDR